MSRTCKTEKVPFPKNEAEKVAKQMNHRQYDWPVHAYWCGECGWWHIGHVRSIGMGRRRRRI